MLQEELFNSVLKDEVYKVRWDKIFFRLKRLSLNPYSLYHIYE